MSAPVVEQGDGEGTDRAEWLDLRDPTFYQRDPQETWERLREADGLVRDRNGFVALARFADVMAAEHDAAALSSARGYRVHWEPLERTMISQDDPGHLAQRRRVSPTLTPRAVAAHADGYRALVRELVDAALAEHEETGAVEVVDALAAPLPCRITATMIGFDEGDWRKIKDWSERQMRLDTRDVDPEIHESFTSSIYEWAADMQPILAERRVTPADDLFSRWIAPPDGHDPLPMMDMVGEVGLLIAGGAETTRTLISHGLRTFCDHPDQWELLHREPDRIPAAVEELLRWVSPLNNMFRTAVRDTAVGGHPVSEGERVALLYPAANRDPRAFEGPHRFDVTRKETVHLAFGHGTHFCLGANLARLEVRLLLEELTARITDLHPVDEPDVEPNVFARAVRRFDLGFRRR
jgi:cytochrome P450 family 142 subfamily A polypeptide 1